MSNFAQVSPGIFVSGWEFAWDEAALKRYNISHILIVANELQPAFPSKFEYKVKPVKDVPEEDILSLFPVCCGFVEKARRRGLAVLLHYYAFQSRSVAFAAAYIMAKQRMSADEALSIIAE